MSISFLVFLVIGQLFVYLGMKFPPLANSKFKFVKQLWTCSECCGVWVFTFLSIVMGESLFREIFYVPFVSELATGGLVGFLMHVFVYGWKSKFETIIIE